MPSGVISIVRYSYTLRLMTMIIANRMMAMARPNIDKARVRASIIGMARMKHVFVEGSFYYIGHLQYDLCHDESCQCSQRSHDCEAQDQGIDWRIAHYVCDEQ